MDARVERAARKTTETQKLGGLCNLQCFSLYSSASIVCQVSRYRRETRPRRPFLSYSNLKVQAPHQSKACNRLKTAQPTNLAEGVRLRLRASASVVVWCATILASRCCRVRPYATDALALAVSTAPRLCPPFISLPLYVSRGESLDKKCVSALLKLLSHALTDTHVSLHTAGKQVRLSHAHMPVRIRPNSTCACRTHTSGSSPG